MIILNPSPASQQAASPNNQSVTLKLTMGHVSFLFPGDIEAAVERGLVYSDLAPHLAATILKSPHHGSQTSSSSLFLEAVNPLFVVISAGEDNPFGHPHQAVLDPYAEFGIQVLRTDELGTVEFITDGERLWMETRE